MLWQCQNMNHVLFSRDSSSVLNSVQGIFYACHLASGAPMKNHGRGEYLLAQKFERCTVFALHVGTVLPPPGSKW